MTKSDLKNHEHMRLSVIPAKKEEEETLEHELRELHEGMVSSLSFPRRRESSLLLGDIQNVNSTFARKRSKVFSSFRLFQPETRNSASLRGRPSPLMALRPPL
ncbi:MAG: hypothetical protein HY801_14870 [Candidatus Lindowbacteria bacterium]|nr:hypothetical protein [Candidatus Lindowbacteria bacterium]